MRWISRHSASNPWREGSSQRVSDGSPTAGQLVDCRDAKADVRHLVPSKSGVVLDIAGCERSYPPMVDAHVIRSSLGKLTPVECGVCAYDGRPRVPVRRSLAGKIAGVEFCEGGVKVIGVECDAGRYPVVSAAISMMASSSRPNGLGSLMVTRHGGYELKCVDATAGMRW